MPHAYIMLPTSATGREWMTGTDQMLGIRCIPDADYPALGRMCTDSSVTLTGVSVEAKLDIADLTGRHYIRFDSPDDLANWIFEKSDADSNCGGAASKVTLNVTTGHAYIAFNEAATTGSLYVPEGVSYAESEVNITGISLMNADAGVNCHVDGILWGGRET